MVRPRPGTRHCIIETDFGLATWKTNAYTLEYLTTKRLIIPFCMYTFVQAYKADQFELKVERQDFAYTKTIVLVSNDFIQTVDGELIPR